MGINSVLIAVETIAPYCIKQLLSGKNLSRIAGEMEQQVELFARQIRLLCTEMR